MERPRALPLRTCALFLGLSFGSFVSGCNPKIEELSKERSKRDTLGQEIYKVLCRRVAGTELPMDIDGSDTELLCLGDQQDADAELKSRRAALPPRLVALAERRKQIADALNEGFPDDTASGIEDLLQSLLPFYDPPEEILQEGTRRTAAMLQRLVDDQPALEAMARFGREGMLSQEGDFGVTRAALSYRRIADVLATTLPALTTEALKPALSAALKGVALELATTELETDPSSDTCHTRDLFSRSEKPGAGETPQFASGTPLYTAARDVRGMPIPKRDNDEGSVEMLSACGTGGEVRPVPYPFVDADNDGFADVDGVNFSREAGFSGVLPEPFEVVGEGEIERDAYGRAYGMSAQGGLDKTRGLYVTRDADATLLAASLRVGARAFAPGSSLLENLALALPALLGDSKETVRSYGKATHRYTASDPDRSPLVALLHASSVLTADPVTDESAEMSQKLLREQEVPLMKSFEPLLALERNTRPDNDLYPDAHLEPNNTFWNEILWEAEKMSRRRNSKDGETLLEATMRASLGFGRNFGKPGAPMEQLIDAELLSRQGSILAMLMRFKDEWRGNPRPRDERPPGDPEVIGTLNTPVDRMSAPTPVTCGADGCGGVIAGTPFERWKLPDKGNCAIPGLTRRMGNAVDCGAPANQSILHRSMGLLAELAGRAQCSRPITVRDLFDFASTTDSQTPQEQADLESTIREAETALAEDYTCPTNSPSAACRGYAQLYPSAFLPRRNDTGQALPPAILECHLLDLADVGRTFGQVLTHEYQLVVPNPWVRRYLEDVARAADASLPTCQPGSITDPKVAPPCVTNAAKLSRSVFDELPNCPASDPTCIDTLSELIEFLLDDKTLFQSEQDERELRPDARTLTRVLFAPAGVSKGFQLFDPLLIAHAPPICGKADTRPSCKLDDSKATPQDDERCCIDSLENAPLRFRLDTYYGATTYAWEHMFKFKDGKQLSFLDAGVSVSDAFNRLDIPAGADANDFEDQTYIFTNLGNLLALHYDSPENMYVQGRNPNLPGYRKLTGLVRYEDLLADLADDGSLDLKQKGPHGGDMFASGLSYKPEQQLGFLAKSLDLLLALDAMSFHGGDGISALARSTESLLNPHAWCAGEGGDKRVVRGRGACDAATPARPPITARDGRDYQCYRDGSCFDGKTAGVPKRFVSSADLLFDALWDIDDRRKSDPKVEVATRALLGNALDAFAQLENSRLKDRRLRAVSLAMGDYGRERWADEKAKGTLPTFGQRNTDDTIDTLTNPAVAGGLDVLRGLVDQEGALPALEALLFALLDERSEPSAARAFLAYSADALQSLPGDANSNALLKSFAFAAAPNIDAVLAGSEKELDVVGSVAWNNVISLGETGKADVEDVLGRFLGAMVGARKPDASRPAPVTVLYDALIDINRKEPLASGQHDAADYREAFKRIADVMLDERRGFERMYSLVRCSREPKDPICD